MIAKYVCTAQAELFIFSATVAHSMFINSGIVSAGFIRFMSSDNGTIDCECFGESTSLNVKSRPTDSKLAKRFLFCELCLECGNCEGRYKQIKDVTMSKLCTTNNTFGTVKYETNVIESIDFMLDYLYEHELIKNKTKQEIKTELLNKLMQ